MAGKSAAGPKAGLMFGSLKKEALQAKKKQRAVLCHLFEFLNCKINQQITPRDLSLEGSNEILNILIYLSLNQAFLIPTTFRSSLLIHIYC